MTTSTAQREPLPKLPELGEVLDDRFELRGMLGEGGMGHVFRAHDLESGREIAIKLLTPRYLGRPERELRFLRELELGTRAEHHRNLVDYLGGGRLRQSGWPFLVMDLVPGRDLASLLVHGPLESLLAVRLARQVAGAAQALHRAGVVHRDMTTMNVLVSDENAVLIDLSHAAEIAAPQPTLGHRRLTRDHEVPGTPHYMAPEQARAEPAHPAMDVYAFGVMLVHMLTGVAPGGCGRDAFIELQSEGRLRPPRIDTRVYTEVPLVLAELVDACTGTDPRRRPTMDELVRRLDELLVVMATSAADVSGPLAAANGTAEETSTEAEAASVRAETEERGGVRRGLVLAAITIGLAALAGSASLWPSPHEEEPKAGRERAVMVAEQPGADAPAEESPSVSVPMQKTTLEPESGGSTPPGSHDVAAVPTPPEMKPTASERREPSAKRSRRRRPRPSSSPLSTPERANPCEQTLAQAAEARRSRRWAQVAQLTRSATCWNDATARLRLRIKALSELARYGECVTASETSNDPEVKRLATHCARRLDAEAP